MPAKAMVPVDALPYIHLASEPLGFGRHMTVRRHSHVSALIHRFRGHGSLLQHRWIRHPLWEWAELL